jgi:alkanesulfonate monooxygenase SsuD/methylene tetrahydromethanopterin reductase-like flavin-dependent oxidoreductase (luciferase family)
MLVGTFHFPTDYGIDVSELAAALEQRGFESLFVCEHTHIPASRRTPFPSGGELPKRYSHTHDPFVALSFAAAATRTLKLGTGICLLPQRDPIVTAKSRPASTSSRRAFHLRPGRRLERRGDGEPRCAYDTRFKLLRERALAMKALWTQEEANSTASS